MIHPTAIIDKQAMLGDEVQVGPYAVIEGPVEIGSGTQIKAHAHIEGHTKIGNACVIHPFASVGGPPQDLGYKGERSYCRVGDRTIIREGVTIHRGTDEGSVTEVGSDCMIMSNTHIAHNCSVGDHVILSSNVLLAGHATLCHHAIMGGASAVHQFARIGEYTMISGSALMTRDGAPFMIYSHRCVCHGVNRIGMRRGGFDSTAIDEIRHLHRVIFRQSSQLYKAAADLTNTPKTDAGRRFIEFILEESKRGIAASRRGKIGKNG
ncbi:MAG: acyl-ACP--UDP-N-acetylglucosamine O-acyltransferase [Planctomycetes bacterium]|nr:acyl-ACP--UDP-N-acetylglucosamine O-acyltransferase [Planctomycetota bacterium]